MRRVAVLSALLLPGLLLGFPAAVPAGSFQFVSIDFPDATSTQANGINTSGMVVGTYRDATSIHGFSREADGTYRRFDVHNAIFTSATGISDDGRIVGTYQDQDGKTHGFVHMGTSRPIDVPGAGATCATGINSVGQIVGSFGASCPRGATQGFLLAKGVFSPAVVFHTSDVTATSTTVSGINSAGQIVGNYTDSRGTIHGFALAGGTFSTLDVPGAAATFALGINAGGQIVGGYTDSSGATHGLLLVGGSQWILPVDFPRDTAIISYTQLNGINDAGQIVGIYLGSDGLFHGFVGVLSP
jgi:probable HAF family extracellular repeat protein